jgi:RimJ/RimL family protein N-acetyltransferase
MPAAGPPRGHWRRGIGRRLAAGLEAWARAQNVRRLTGLVQAHNTRALRFAAAWGFHEELVSPGYAVVEGRAVDRVRVVKLL